MQAECVKLNGAMELAPMLGLAPRIVDLVSSGRTLKENGLVEVEVIAEVTSRLIVNRAAFKTRAESCRWSRRSGGLVERRSSRLREGSGEGRDRDRRLRAPHPSASGRR